MCASISGVVDFRRNFIDPETPLQRIGRGHLGGKARGLAYIRSAINEKIDFEKYPGIQIDIPPLAVICSNVFDDFMQRNSLYEIVASGFSDQRIAQAFHRAELPFEIVGDLRSIVNQTKKPIAVRSSSLLEDDKQEPFAGVYATKMLPNNKFDPDLRFRQLAEAIKFVYASTFFKDARSYRQALHYEDKDEKMAVILQDLVGKRHSMRYYPEVSGVARSYNYYPIEPAAAEDGVVSLAMGLGKIVADGGVCWTYSPRFPKVGPPFGSTEQLLDQTQTMFWAVNMAEPAYDPTKEIEYLVQNNIIAAEKDGVLNNLASTYDSESRRLSIGMPVVGPRALTFAPILVLDQFPLNEIITDLLSICESAYESAVEIEFALTFNPNRFSFLQVRKMVSPLGEQHIRKSDLAGKNILVSSERALGNGIVDSIEDIVFTKPDSFSLKHTKEIAPQLERINAELLDAGRPYLLIVLGRLGTTDPWLGIPIPWGQISGAQAVIEATQENVKVELSQGSHYFHNILSLGIKYFLLPTNSEYQIDWQWLENQETTKETEYLRHIRLGKPLRIMVDGRNSRGIIYKS